MVRIPRSRPNRPPVGRAVASSNTELTVRERDVLELLARCMRAKEIASRLSISTHTVNEHLKHAYRKLGVNNRRQAIEQAAQMGIVDGVGNSTGTMKAARGGNARVGERSPGPERS